MNDVFQRMWVYMVLLVLSTVPVVMAWPHPKELPYCQIIRLKEGSRLSNMVFDVPTIITVEGSNIYLASLTFNAQCGEYRMFSIYSRSKKPTYVWIKRIESKWTTPLEEGLLTNQKLSSGGTPR